MNSHLPHFEKYSVAPCPSRDYYGIKIIQDKVILYLWKVSYGPHLYPIVTETEFSKFNEDKALQEEIEQVFGSHILDYVYLIISGKTNTLLTLPIYILQRLVFYLNLEDISKLFCVSQLYNEIFDTNSIWESFFKKLKGRSELTEMEKNLGVSQGFKQLVKDQHMNNMLRKSYKLTSDDSKHKVTRKNEKLSCSLDTNLSDVAGQNDYKHLTKKHSIDTGVKRVQRSSTMKPLGRSSLVSQDKNTNISKKIASEDKSSRLYRSKNFIDTCGVGEGYQKLNQKLNLASTKKKNGKPKQTEEQKNDFLINDQSELLLQKKKLESMLANINIEDDSDDEDYDDEIPTSTNKKNPILISPRSIFTKSSECAFNELKNKPQKKSTKTAGSQNSYPAKYNIPTLLNERNDESDMSGLSYIMKKYLQTNDDVAIKLPEDTRTTTSKNSSIQSNFNEDGEYRSLKKAEKSTVNTSKNESTRNTSNLLSKIKNIQKV